MSAVSSASLDGQREKTKFFGPKEDAGPAELGLSIEDEISHS